MDFDASKLKSDCACGSGKQAGMCCMKCDCGSGKAAMQCCHG